MWLLSTLSITHYRWLAVLWTGGIIAACSIPATTLSPVEPALSADKAIHVGLFAVFGVLWMRVSCPPSVGMSQSHLWWKGLWLLMGGGLFAVGTEVYQHLLPIQRIGDPYDALADGGGLLLAVVGYVLISRLLISNRSSGANEQ